MAGRLKDAWAFVEEAASADHFLDAELNILRGDLFLASPAPDESAAQAAFGRAAAFAEARGARMSHLIAATRLASLRRSAPGDDEAYAALRAVYSTFTEGFDTPQLVAARAVLDGS